MTPATLERIFQPFIQADTSLDRSRGGLGLGLALVKGLVELHGGEVSANSAGLGKGSEFTVRVPIAQSNSGATPVQQPSLTTATSRSLRVLIIDDNVDLADSLSELLVFDGHEAIVAYNGSEGLAKARELSPDVVLCDIGLPEMDGYEVAKVIRAEEKLRNVLLIALTGYAQPADLQRVMAAGFDRHLAKPADLVLLQKILADVPA